MLLAAREIIGDVIGALGRLQFELANKFLRVRVDLIDGHAEPLVDSSVQQSVGENEKEDHRNQGNTQKGHDHLGLKTRAQLLLLPLDVELQQDAQENESKDNESQKNNGRKYEQQDRLFRIVGADETQVQGGLAPAQKREERNED